MTRVGWNTGMTAMICKVDVFGVSVLVLVRDVTILYSSDTRSGNKPKEHRVRSRPTC